VKKIAGAVLITVVLLVAILYRPRPSIFIIRDYPADSLQGKCRVVDYTIGGYATSAVFYEDEFGRYEDFIAELEKEGRLKR
jgi:hypothetical protein